MSIISGPEQSQLLTRLRDKPFWIWSEKEHKEKDRANKGDCCFNHIIGLPRKDGIEKSIFDYEKLLYDSLLTPDSGLNNISKTISNSRSYLTCQACYMYNLRKSQ